VAKPPPPFNSAEELLQSCGLAASEATELVARASSWRVRPKARRDISAAPPHPAPCAQATGAGRQLQDKRKARLVTKNAASVVAALAAQGVSGPALAALLRRWPGLLELDCGAEWEERLAQLAARVHAAGPSSRPACALQEAWEERQREDGASGSLSLERVRLLDAVAFDWGVCDRDWEHQFDLLLAYRFATGGAALLAPGAPPAPRTLLDWARRQAAMASMGTLPPAAAERLRRAGLLAGPRRAPEEEAQLVRDARAARAAREEALVALGAPRKGRGRPRTRTPNLRLA